MTPELPVYVGPMGIWMVLISLGNTENVWLKPPPATVTVPEVLTSEVMYSAIPTSVFFSLSSLMCEVKVVQKSVPRLVVFWAFEASDVTRSKRDHKYFLVMLNKK